MEYRASDKKVAHIIITHGFFVAKFGAYFDGYTSYANYCSISGIEIQGDYKNLFFDSKSDHIKTWGDDCMRY